MSKVLVGMSGGVDSSVAAKLLQDQGHDIAGVTLKLFSNEDIVEAEKTGKTCCALSDVQDAQSVAYRLNIEHFVYNFRDFFGKHVIENFVNQYLKGKTPNPCIECNRWIKFDSLLQRARLLGFDAIATGHYARISFNQDTGRWELRKGRSLEKDQSYVLYTLTQDQLAHTLFPLGDLDKSQVRSIGEAAGLINARKPDSQDICFIPGGKYGEFIEKKVPGIVVPGDYLDKDGKVIGKHKGVAHYTIGQRRGIGIALGVPTYVTGKDAQTNTVSLGSDDELFAKELIAENLNLISIEKLTEPLQVKAKIRYSHKEQDAVLYPLNETQIRVVFNEPQRAITPGQAVVFYSDDLVVGGGTIV